MLLSSQGKQRLYLFSLEVYAAHLFSPYHCSKSIAGGRILQPHLPIPSQASSILEGIFNPLLTST